MDIAGLDPGCAGPRVRHRSRRRKLAESIGLIVGVPLLLLALLALSVELIEYHPTPSSPSVHTRSQRPAARPAAPLHSQPRTEALVVPPFDPQSDLGGE